jgi:hypothetical protein
LRCRVAHQGAFAGKIGIFFLFVSPLRTATQREATEALERRRHRLAEIGSNDVHREAHSPKGFAKQTRPIDVAVLDEQDGSLPHKILPQVPGPGPDQHFPAELRPAKHAGCDWKFTPEFSFACCRRFPAGFITKKCAWTQQLPQ